MSQEGGVCAGVPRQERGRTKQDLRFSPEAVVHLLCGLRRVSYPSEAFPHIYMLEKGRFKPNLPDTKQGMWLLGHLSGFSPAGLIPSLSSIG